MEQIAAMDELDRLAAEAFPGLVVRKDLLRRMRTAFSVPAFVIEFLLGKYCASTDEETINEGLEFVRETLSSKYVKPDQREAVKSAIKQHSSYEVIDNSEGFGRKSSCAMMRRSYSRVSIDPFL
jgi:ATP-dependent Lon protease